jgi:hypothetical protein
MKSGGVSDESDRFPLWDAAGTDCLLRVGSRAEPSDFQERCAVALTAAEERMATSSTNHFFMRVGHPRVLANHWLDVFIEVGRVYRFAREQDWGRQRAGFESLFRGFFESNADRSQCGWVSLITMQRPQHLRSVEDSRIRVENRAVLLGRSCGLNDAVAMAGMHERAPAEFTFRSGGRSSRTRLRRVEIHRALHAPNFLARDRRLIEWRYVPSVDGEHDDILRAGRIPSNVISPLNREIGLGTNGYLNLVKVALSSSGAGVLMNNTLEISPESGRIVSLRAFETSVETALLCASVVEHSTLCDIVRDIVGSPGV